MRSLTASISIVLTVVSTIVLIGSCNNMPTNVLSPAKGEDPSTSQLKLDNKFTSTGDIRFIFEKFLEQNRKNGKKVMDSKKYDFSKESRIDIPGSEIKILVIEKIGNTVNRNTSIFGFQINDMIAPYFVINEIYNVGKNQFRVELKTVSGLNP